MRADRLLSILLLLQVRRQITARELAQRLGVSARTIHRDMEALSGAGVPVLAERGTGGGWHLLEEYRTNLTGLSDAEVQALFLTSPGRLFADLGLARATDGALIKLLAALPTRHRHRAEDVQQRIHIDVAGWRQIEGTVPTLPLVQEAIWGERKLRIVYQRGEGRDVERIVDPLGLVAKGSLWYLVAAHGASCAPTVSRGSGWRRCWRSRASAPPVSIWRRSGPSRRARSSPGCRNTARRCAPRQPPCA